MIDVAKRVAITIDVDLPGASPVSTIRTWTRDGNMTAMTLDPESLRGTLRAIADMLGEVVARDAAKAAKP